MLHTIYGTSALNKFELVESSLTYTSNTFKNPTVVDDVILHAELIVRA